MQHDMRLRLGLISALVALCCMGGFLLWLGLARGTDVNQELASAARELAEASELIASGQVAHDTRERALRLLAFCLGALIPVVIAVLLLRYVLLSQEPPASTLPLCKGCRSLVRVHTRI